MNVTYKLCQLRQPLRKFRNLHTTCLLKNAYEGPGKTTITFVRKEMGARLFINKHDKDGFVFSNGARVIGPTAVFPRYAIGWNVYSAKDINEEALSLFTILEPKPDVLIFGLEDAHHFEYFKKLQELVKKLDITAEILSVHQACVAYNFLNEDGRDVVAALIPPKEEFFKLLPKTKSREQIADNREQITDSS